MNPRENTEAVTKAKALVLGHCMCLVLEETPDHFICIYPQGFRVDGCRVSKGKGKLNALTILLDRMERHWLGGL